MDDLSNIMCVIPARGGSKGIYRKNERSVGGKPLLLWSIEHAIAAGFPCQNIIVSSDAKTILRIANDAGVLSHHRPDNLSTDDSPTELAVIDALNKFSSVEHVIILQPTSPIRFKETLINCIRAYLKGEFDSLLTVSKFYDFFWKEQDRGVWESTYNHCSRPMRQNLSKYDFFYFDNGNIYITDIKILQETKCRIGERPCVFPISILESIQIDTPEDLVCVDSILSNKIGRLI